MRNLFDNEAINKFKMYFFQVLGQASRAMALIPKNWGTCKFLKSFPRGQRGITCQHGVHLFNITAYLWRNFQQNRIYVNS